MIVRSPQAVVRMSSMKCFIHIMLFSMVRKNVDCLILTVMKTFLLFSLFSCQELTCSLISLLPTGQASLYIENGLTPNHCGVNTTMITIEVNASLPGLMVMLKAFLYIKECFQHYRKSRKRLQEHWTLWCTNW